MTHTTLVSIDTFAFNLGAQTKAVRENSLPFHNAFVKGDAAQQRDLRVRWMCNHMAGNLGIALAQATVIREKGKGAGVKPEHKAAIDKAYSDFRYYVVTGKGAKGKEQDVTRDELAVPRNIQALANELAKACAGYEDAKKLAATALANAFAAK